MRRRHTDQDVADLALARRLEDTLDRARAKKDNAEELATARRLAHILSNNRALAFAPNRELTRRLANSLDLACDLAAASDVDTALHLAWAAEGTARAALRAENTLDQAATTVEAVHAARAMALDARRARAELFRRLEFARTFAWPADGDPVGEARVTVAKVIRQLARDTTAVISGRPGLVCRNVLGLALQVLPRTHRPRFEEEFRSELAELPRGRQIRYAARQLAHSFALRRYLVRAAAAEHGRS
ncbi:hypothetical protein VA596_26310 [Amycolatopsis sp., V23-08]|uniref:CHAD domain-containing protein n=1 Tax=Amycolatopsis heterodermiae TaxID=3110235 RepID=A0ABU5R9Z1_9PSEU|nr:hypothetical protein [Amycolatopsis sp., V23-08]MEA5363072.1 hypothetical protein [Amycolatopsis sp., V23-08]